MYDSKASTSISNNDENGTHKYMYIILTCSNKSVTLRQFAAW